MTPQQTTRAASLLVVDDNEDNRDTLSLILRQRGYVITEAATGHAAIQLLAASRFDLVLLDVEMPGMNGFELLAHVRRTRSHTALPVIMVTARTAADDVATALQAGANDYVTKPIAYDVLFARIETHLGHKRAIENLHDSEERYALAVEGANDGLWDWNVTTGEVYWSPRWRSIVGVDHDTISTSPDEWLSRIHPDDRERVESALTAHLGGGAGPFESEHRVRYRDDTYRWVQCRGAAIRDDRGQALRFAGSLADITSAKLADSLTGLPNRLLFLDVVERALTRAERNPEYGFGILVLALDRFHIVRDSLGASAVDRLLVAVARRLQSGLRLTDMVARDGSGPTLSRHGGDEFTMLVDDITDVSGTLVVAERLRRSLEAPFEVDGHRVFLPARIGIAASFSGYTKPEDILRDAGLALNRAKSTQGVPYEIFDPEMRRRAVRRLATETDLRHAIEREHFEVHYQPIVSLANGCIAGFEALVRWRHPERGLVQPPEFIGIAEDTGVIVDIDRLTLAESCRQMAAWMREFGATAPQTMCANLSGRQFANAELMTHIANTLRDTGLAPSNLKLEITENAFIADVPAARQLLDRARALGVEWSLDDFGTGFSSLSFLHQLQVNTVKIDRSFVSAMGADTTGLAMVRAIVGLAHALGMDVVAEGVETGEQAAQLRAIGCEYAQGFYFSKAVDPATAGRLIAAQPWHHVQLAELVQ